MHWASNVCGIIFGICLAAIQIRHFGWLRPFLFLNKAADQEPEHFDSTDKKLAFTSLMAFLLALLFNWLSHN
jgi:hypothetical protein